MKLREETVAVVSTNKSPSQRGRRYPNLPVYEVKVVVGGDFDTTEIASRHRKAQISSQLRSAGHWFQLVLRARRTGRCRSLGAGVQRPAKLTDVFLQLRYARRRTGGKKA